MWILPDTGADVVQRYDLERCKGLWIHVDVGNQIDVSRAMFSELRARLNRHRHDMHFRAQSAKYRAARRVKKAFLNVGLAVAAYNFAESLTACPLSMTALLANTSESSYQRARCAGLSDMASTDETIDKDG